MTGPGALSFVTHEDVQVYIHSPNEVPYDTEKSIRESIFYGSKNEIVLKVTEMVNDLNVQDVSIKNRKCRFPWERNGIPYPILYHEYSYSSCRIECLMSIQLEICNCTHHLMPQSLHKGVICDVDGLICLTNNSGKSQQSNAHTRTSRYF